MRPACRPTPVPPTRGDDHERCSARLDTRPPCTDVGRTASPISDLVRTRHPRRRRRRGGLDAVRRPAVERAHDAAPIPLPPISAAAAVSAFANDVDGRASSLTRPRADGHRGLRAMTGRAHRSRRSTSIGARGWREHRRVDGDSCRHIAAATLRLSRRWQPASDTASRIAAVSRHAGGVASPDVAALHPFDPPDSLSGGVQDLRAQCPADPDARRWRVCRAGSDPFVTTARSLAIDCEAARVSIDGRPFSLGAGPAPRASRCVEHGPVRDPNGAPY